MAGNSKSDPPPYSRFSDSQRQQPFIPPNTTGRTRLVEGVSQARSDHLRGVIYTKVIPIIEQRAAYGLSHTEIAIIPNKLDQNVVQSRDLFNSGFEESLNDSNLNELDNIDSDDEVIQLSLTSSMDTPRFWSQKAVIEELRRMILYALTTNTDDGTLASPDWRDGKAETSSQLDSSAFATSPTPGHGTTSRLSRLTRIIKNELDTKRQRASPSVGTNNIHVKTETQEICTRTTNDFGLYETLTKEAVVVSIKLGDLE